MSWWHLTPDELLSGETVVREKAAGAFIKLKDFNLRSLGSWNWAGTEKLGGRLHLTNYRLGRVDSFDPDECGRNT